VVTPERRISSWEMISMVTGTSLSRCGEPVALVVIGSPKSCSSEP
jgi:hypothetical protein